MSITRRKFAALLGASALVLGASLAVADDYAAPQALKDGSQADNSKIKKQDKVVIAYMPPATEFNYYIAIGEGIKAAAAADKVEK